MHRSHRGPRCAAAAAAAVLATGCAPPGTRHLSEAQRAQALGVVEQMRIESPCARRLVAWADPLFDLRGEAVEDNAAVAEGISLVVAEAEAFVLLDRVLVVDRSTHESWSPLAAGAYAWGSHTPGVPGDDYIVEVVPDGQEELAMDPGTLVHESTHFHYGNHDIDVLACMNSGAEACGPAPEITRLILDHRDAPYALGRLFEAVHLAYRVATEPEERVIAEVEEAAALPRDSEAFLEAAESARGDQYWLESRRKASAWERAEHAVTVFHGSASFLARIGVTRDEAIEAMAGCSEIWDAQDALIEQALVLIYSTFSPRDGADGGA
ncbi:hypothetical protein L6R50_23855 [Myxococcota bacterium]|nr:hypothetical protein [Myxococcota bacterium]